MKKVPFVGDLEESFDKSIKEAMGDFKVLYPALKLGLIYSNPTSALAYTGYRAMPYLWSGITSKKALNLYKSVGKTVGKNALKIGIGSALLLGKYSGKALMGLGKLAKKQFDNTVDYFSEKDFSLSNIKDKLNIFKLSKEKIFGVESGGFLNSKSNIKQIDNSMIDERIIKQSRSAAYLLDISQDEHLNNVKERILNGELEYNEETGKYYYKNKDKDLNKSNNNINKEDINNKDIESTVENEEKPLKVIKIGGSDEVVFNKRDGKIFRQYNLCGAIGQEHEITEEEYNSYIVDVDKDKTVDNELNKDKDKDMEFS